LDSFKFILPAEIVKSKDGEWKVSGLATSNSRDRQGEVILPNGIDATPIAQGKGFLNFDHDNSPESTIGVLDSYKKTKDGMFVEGRLFKNHTKAKAIYEIMSSLGKSDTGRVGMSVEGKVLERDPNNPSIIRRCIIKNVAITMNPVNTDTYADIIKSFNGAESITFDSSDNREPEVTIDVLSVPIKSEGPTFTTDQVMSIVEKALGISAGVTAAPATLTGGDALTTESLDEDKKKKLKKKSKSIAKSEITGLLDKLQVLYPDCSRTILWNSIKDRLETKFPELKNR
jgi:hypothetical protein